MWRKSDPEKGTQSGTMSYSAQLIHNPHDFIRIAQCRAQHLYTEVVNKSKDRQRWGKGGEIEGKRGREPGEERQVKEKRRREDEDEVGWEVGFPVYTQYWLCFSAGLVCRQSSAMSGSRFTQASQVAHFSTGSTPREAG